MWVKKRNKTGESSSKKGKTMTNKKQNELNFAFGEGFKLARVVTRGAGLSMEQKFKCFTSTGADKEFVNECLVRRALKKSFAGNKGVWGFELLSTDFKHKAFVPKDKVLKIDILARDLKGLQAVQSAEHGLQRTDNGKQNAECGGHNPIVILSEAKYPFSVIKVDISPTAQYDNKSCVIARLSHRHTEGFIPEVSIQNTECRMRGVDTLLRSV